MRFGRGWTEALVGGDGGWMDWTNMGSLFGSGGVVVLQAGAAGAAVGGEQLLSVVGEREGFGQPFGGGLEYGGDLLVQGTVVGSCDEAEGLEFGHVVASW